MATFDQVTVNGNNDVGFQIDPNTRLNFKGGEMLGMQIGVHGIGQAPGGLQAEPVNVGVRGDFGSFAGHGPSNVGVVGQGPTGVFGQGGQVSVEGHGARGVFGVGEPSTPDSIGVTGQGEGIGVQGTGLIGVVGRGHVKGGGNLNGTGVQGIGRVGVVGEGLTFGIHATAFGDDGVGVFGTGINGVQAIAIGNIGLSAQGNLPRFSRATSSSLGA